MYFISTDELCAKLGNRDNIKFINIEDLNGNRETVKKAVCSGESLIYAGAGNIDLLRELWIESYEGDDDSVLSFSKPPANFPDDITVNKGKCRYINIRPNKEYLYHGIDEEIRADIHPIIEARDRFGDLRGYPAVLIKNYADSLVGRNYKGGFWYIFMFEEPEKAISLQDWQRIVDAAYENEAERCIISRLKTEYPIYSNGEKIKIECSISNNGSKVAGMLVRLEAIDAYENSRGIVGEVQRCLNPGETVSFPYDWYCSECGDFYKIKAYLYSEDILKYGTAREQNLKLLDMEECGVIIKQPEAGNTLVEVDGTCIKINGNKCFFTGTHYYPSSSFYEWTWRDFIPDRAIKDFDTMKRYGIRIVRIWADPILDEASLRGMEACLELCKRNGMVAIVTIFTSWVRWLEINVKDKKGKVQIMDFKNDALVGLFLHNIEFQCDYTSIISERFKDNSGIIWNISNEFAVINPDDSQIDTSWMSGPYKEPFSPYRNSAIFLEWSDKIKLAIRSTGAVQPVIAGTSCWDVGSDNYLSNKHGDIIPWHAYTHANIATKYIIQNNATCINKPVLIEEFGKVRINDADMAEHYDKMLHYFIGISATGACFYEWGVSWLTRELPYIPSPMKYIDGTPLSEHDSRVFRGRYEYAKSWPVGGIGICPWAASFNYGINHPCTPCPSPAMSVVEKISYIGEELGTDCKPSKVYLVVPMEFSDFAPYDGYHRKADTFFEAIEGLWKNGAVFGVWQEDSLYTLPESTEMIIFPNECEIKAETLRNINVIESRGIKVYKGNDFSWKDCLSEKVDFKPMDDARLLVRNIERGRLYFIDNLRREKRKFELFISGVMLEMELEGFGLVMEKDNKIVMAEFQGRLAIDGDVIADSKDGRCVIKSGSSDDLRNSKNLVIMAYGPMQLFLNGIYKTAQILSHDGQVLDKITVGRKGGLAALNIDTEISSYRISIFR